MSEDWTGFAGIQIWISVFRARKSVPVEFRMRSMPMPAGVECHPNLHSIRWHTDNREYDTMLSKKKKS